MNFSLEDRSSKTLLQTPNLLITPLYFLLRKEVIHPHVPVGIPCYDLTPVIGPAFRSSKTLLQTPNLLITPLYFLLRKEVIHPHVPVGIPCYDLTPVIGPAFDDSLPFRLCHRLRALPASMV